MPTLLASTLTQIALLLIFVAMLTVIMILTRNRVRNSMRSSGPGVREQYARMNEKRQALRDTEDVMIELDRVARQVHGQLDTRFAKLETVIRDADARIEKLERLMRKAADRPTLDITLDEARPDELEPPPVMESGPHADVYRLADAGMDRVQIAEETGKTTGEVELILALRKAKPAASTS